MLKPIRDPLLCASPSQSFPSTSRLLTYLAGFYLKEENTPSTETAMRNALIYQLSTSIEAFRTSDYPFVNEDGDFKYVLNLATFVSHDHQGSRKWRKVKVVVYDQERAALIQVYEINIPLSTLNHDSTENPAVRVSHA